MNELLRLHKRNETAPGMWRYFCPETSRWVPDSATHGSPTFFAFGDLIEAVRQHYIANGLQVPYGFELLVEDQCCRSLPPKWCRDSQGRRPRGKGLTPFNFTNVIHGTKALARFLLAGRPRESDSEVIRRSNICKKCHFHRNPQECKSCGGETLSGIAQAIVGGRSLPSDAGLKACAVCGCGLVVATRVPTKFLNDGVPQEEMDTLPEFCWRRS